MIVTPVLCSDLVDRFQQYLHIQVGIHPLRQCHGTGVTYDLLCHGRFHLSLRQHRDTGVPCVMGLVVEAQAFHYRSPVTVCWTNLRTPARRKIRESIYFYTLRLHLRLSHNDQMPIPDLYNYH